ncbi:MULTISPECIES: molybdopterin-dependent oxidoreductase [unclassified Streptomyces]|uniref:molybdopterin-dependent oxidoreductase n=1 Tax=unclassified Streptomyces TaxID=2593676 RepID=UPI000DC78F52|nr:MULTISPECIES: molybdopterin-dependent oxidoreductase [unclassified Streptomyces]AWZ06370.1 molybdopterin-binding oxidoreductase [Streptomyces sp. ICC4]AWZ14224.1 molybdopterin-binding oxidoreductase [Streptomyces sp. ICC1]
MRVVSINRRTVERGALAAASGLLAGFAALAAAELTASLVRPQAGPVTVIGGAAIDRTPAALKDFAIRTFGENDKLVLQLGILATVGLLAALLGMFSLRHRRTGAAGVLAFGALGAAAALSRPDAAGAGDVLPSLVGGVTGALVLYLLVGKVGVPAARPAGATGTAEATAAGTAVGASAGAAASGAADGGAAPTGWNRRGFLLAAGATAVLSTGAGALGRALTGRRGAGAAASRTAVRLPAPASPAAPIPAGAALRTPGISSFTTPNKDFYRVDTALVVPKVDAETWRLRIHGKGVSRPRSYSFAELLQRPLIERDITLTCVSNEVGGPYAGSARWLGVRLSDLLREAGVTPPSRGGRADQLIARSVDAMTLGTPVEDVMDGRDAMLAVGMNGEPLPFEHGFPVRMVVPGLYGYVSACKWIRDIELTTFDAYDPYWVKRGWARRAPIKTQARIDTPKPFARTPAGPVTVAGVAWAQHRGIERVEVRVDDGPWQEADLAAQATTDTWRQWSFPWQTTPGGHTLTVRATDGTGEVQTEERTRTIPDGASGRHSVFVTAN